MASGSKLTGELSDEESRELALLKLQVQTFYQVNHFVGSIYNPEQLLDLIMREAEAAVGAEASCIAIYQQADQRLHIEFASGDADVGVKHMVLEMGQGVLGEAAATGKAVCVDDVNRDSRFDPSIDRQTGFTTKSILATPILRRDELRGVLEVINKKATSHPNSHFTEEDAALLEVVATQAAVAIENARLFQQAVQSERLALIGRMASSIIHDLKQPMSVIRGFAELLGRPEVEGERRRTFSDLILADVDRFVGMSEELLDYSRGTVNVEPREVELGDWLDNLLTSVLRKLSAPGIPRNLDENSNADSTRIRLETRFDYRGRVSIDSERLRRAVSNIVTNAVDAMPDGGTFTVRTKLSEGYWEMELEDTGGGIPIEIRPKIMEPFLTFGKEYGTGLGLAVVQNIVEAHGGEIHFQSRVAGEVPGEGPGTVFILRMPVDHIPPVDHTPPVDHIPVEARQPNRL